MAYDLCVCGEKGAKGKGISLSIYYYGLLLLLRLPPLPLKPA